MNVSPVKGTQNQVTLEVYTKYVLTYIQNTPQTYLPYQKAMLSWIDATLEHTPKSGKILEIGSATPRDATYMRSKGYFVQCSDASVGFISHLKTQGENALKLNILTDPVNTNYNLIFANGVIPHFSRQEFEYILKRFFQSLHPGTVFSFNTKEGEGEAWVNEKAIYKRYICYWQPEELLHLLEKVGFTITYFKTNAPGDLPNHKWIHVIAKK